MKKNLLILVTSLLLTSCSFFETLNSSSSITSSVSSSSNITTSSKYTSEEINEVSSSEETSSILPSTSEYIHYESITLSETNKTLIIGESFTLVPVLSPSNASEVYGSWMTSSRKVATVIDGVVTAVGEGTCRITYSVDDIKVVCTVNVKKDSTTIPVTGITLNKTSCTINVDETLELSYTLSPSNTTEKLVIWDIEDDTIVSINNGVITGLKEGTTKVSVSSLDGLHKAECVVTVTYEEVFKDGYSLLWNDEFEGNSLDTSIWGFDVGGDGWGNSELQYYTNGNNIVLSDGTCKIVARREACNGRQFTSTRMVTRDKKEFTYGYVEARIKVPSYQGAWPAFWLLGKDIYSGQPWPFCGEIDIMEYANSSSKLFGTLHWNANGKNPSSSYVHAMEGLTTYITNKTEFHTYALDWTAESIKILCDDVVFFEKDIRGSQMDCFHDDFYVLINLAIGGQFVNEYNVNNIGFDKTSIMEIDYVRVFQKNK